MLPKGGAKFVSPVRPFAKMCQKLTTTLLIIRGVRRIGPGGYKQKIRPGGPPSPPYPFQNKTQNFRKLHENIEVIVLCLRAIDLWKTYSRRARARR